jgi:hypothetical protein
MLSANKSIEYLNEHLGSQNFLVYDEVLRKLPASEIKSYANRIVKELLINIEESTSKEPSVFQRVCSTIWEALVQKPL